MGGKHVDVWRASVASFVGRRRPAPVRHWALQWCPVERLVPNADNSRKALFWAHVYSSLHCTPGLAAHISRRRRHLRSCRFSPKCLRICVMIVEGVSARREAWVRARTGRESQGAGEIAETSTLGPFPA